MLSNNDLNKLNMYKYDDIEQSHKDDDEVIHEEGESGGEPLDSSDTETTE